MKKNLFFFITALCISFNLYAQPVLHASDLNPVVGDVTIQATAKIAGVKPPVQGANKTWNYAKLKDTTNALDTFHYVKKNGTPYASEFSKANLASTISGLPGQYSYYKTSNAFLQSFGTASPFDTSTWKPPYRIAVFPATYGTNFTDTSTVTLKSGGTTFKQGYRDSTKAVGYGTLKLPKNKTFNNVLMVRTTVIISFKIGNHTYTSKSYSVSFYVAGYHGPLLSISLNQANQVVGATYAKNATASFTDIAEDDDDNNDAISTKSSLSLAIYPNPASSVFTVKFNDDKKATGLFISDLSGNIVYTKRGNIIAGQQINCSALKEGTYMVRLQMDDGNITTQKLEIKK